MVVVKNPILYCVNLFLFVLLFGGCQKKHKNYDYLIKLFPNNQEELKKLINFYYNENDFKKLQFAEFFIETLPSQYTLKYSILHDGRFLLALDKPSPIDSIETLRHMPGNTLRIDTVYTINKFSANFIIDQIEYAYNLKSKYEWVENISLSQFCNYVLPYQVNNEESYNYKAFYGNRYLPYIHDVLVKDLDTNALLGNYIPPFFENLTNSVSGHIDFTSILRANTLRNISNQYKDIEDVKVLETHALRAIGVPCAYEYTPFLEPFMEGDVSVNIFDTGNKSYFSNLSRNVYKYRVAKFYRNVFDLRLAKNPFKELMDMGINSNDIPFSLNIPKCIEVTREKTTTTDIRINVPDSLLSKRILYLATGMNNSWKIVTWSKISKPAKAVLFREMGVNLTYVLSTYSNGKLGLIGRPFKVTISGKKMEL